MQLKTIKTAADLPFEGVEIVKQDASIREVIVHGRLHIRADYGLTVSVRVEGEEAKRHKLTASIEGFDDKVEHFAAKYEAESAERRYKELGARCVLSEVTVLVNELGEVVKEVAESTATTTSDDLAF